MTEAMPLILFGVLFFLLLLGFPVAFTLGGVSFILGYLTFGADFFQSFAPAYLGRDDQLCADCRAFVCVYGGDAGEVRFG